MRRVIPLLIFIAALALPSAPAFADARACTAGDPGCKTESTKATTHETGGTSGSFVVTTTETQRGNVDAKGTENTEITTSTCVGPSGKELRANHPQCQ